MHSVRLEPTKLILIGSRTAFQAYRAKITNKIANITFHKLANEAEQKYPKKTFDKIFAILASPHFFP